MDNGGQMSIQKKEMTGNAKSKPKFRGGLPVAHTLGV